MCLGGLGCSKPGKVGIVGAPSGEYRELLCVPSAGMSGIDEGTCRVARSILLLPTGIL